MWRERGTGKGCSVGDGHTKNLRPRKVIERNTEKRGAPEDIRGAAQGETAPHTGDMTEQGRKDRFGQQGTKIIRRKNAIMQRIMQISHSDDKKDGYTIGILSLYPRHQEKEHYLAGIPLVHVPKPRFSSKYSGLLRSPQELKIIGGPRGMHAL